MIIVPIVGAGSGACGAIVGGKGIKPEVAGHRGSATGAPAVRDPGSSGNCYRTIHWTPLQRVWQRGWHSSYCRGFCGKVLTISCWYRMLEMRSAFLTLLATHRILAEGAGAAALAAALNLAETVRGKRVAVVVSGGNLTLESLREAMDEERAW